MSPPKLKRVETKVRCAPALKASAERAAKRLKLPLNQFIVNAITQAVAETKKGA